MKILAISDVPSKALWDYDTRARLEGIDLILSCGDLPKKYLEYQSVPEKEYLLVLHDSNNIQVYCPQPDYRRNGNQNLAFFCRHWKDIL